MNPGNDNGNPQPDAAGPPDPFQRPPANWREALAALIASRSALVRIEAADTARSLGVRAAMGLLAVICVFFAWTLLLAAGIAMLARATGWPWHFVALGAALAHLIVAAIAARALFRPAPPAFPHTRNEFQKDRLWLENLQNPRKS